MLIHRYMNSKRFLLESKKNIDIDQINTPKELNKVLNTFDYGFIVNGKKIDAKNGDDYRSLSPSDFIKYKCGVCWDYCAYENYWFKKHKYECKLYFVCTNRCTATHTFLVFKENSTYNIFESAMGSHQGIHEYKSYSEAYLSYFNIFKNKHKSDKYVLYEYKQPNKYGLTANEFLDHIFEFGKLIKEK